MVETVLYLFEIHRKMIFRNTSIVVQDMLRKTPKSFNAVTVIPRLLVDQAFRVVKRVMRAKTFERASSNQYLGNV